MKKNKFLIAAISLLSQLPLLAQVQVDHAIQLTGAGTNARLSGIHAVIDSADATSAAVVQNGGLIYAAATGSSNNFNITVNPPVSAYQTGMVFNFISNQSITGPATLNVNNLGVVAIKKNVTQDFSGCEIQNRQVVTVVYDGVNFQMTSAAFSGSASVPSPGTINGPAVFSSNQSGVSYSVAPVNSATSYTWSVPADAIITAGQGTDSIMVSFGASNGQICVTANNSCGNSNSSCLNVSNCYVSGYQAFYYTGVYDSLIVPSCIYSVTIAVHGAQGGGQYSNGGQGGSASGTLAVTPGETLYVYVGGQNGFNGGGAGNNNSTGGGETDVRVGGMSIANWVIVAGGGGGGGNDESSPLAYGGTGGGGTQCVNGAGGGGGGSYPGYCGAAGTPGTCTTGGASGAGCSGGFSGGAGGAGLTSAGSGGTIYSNNGNYGNPGSDGTQGQGGNYGSNSCGTYASAGGGGGGYYGGGGASSGECAGGGGGGGSSWASYSMINTTFTSGDNAGNGSALISW